MLPPARFITDRHCHYDASARRRFKASTEQHMKHLPAGALVVVSMMVQNLQR
jgi:cytochrome b